MEDEDEKLEKEYQTKDPVKRFQFSGHNKSLCLANAYPEMNHKNSVALAPGEGKTPRNILYDVDWDIKGFAHLHSPDGKYGLHHRRLINLTEQHYFIQRICNRNPKFANSPAYVYAAIAYIEQKQIQRILTIDCLAINIHMSRAKGVLTPVRDSNLTNISLPDSLLGQNNYFPREKENFEMFAKLTR